MERKQTYPSLSGLRGIVIFCVVLYHTLELTPLVQTIPLATLLKIQGGRFGNYLFFMISGFLMSHNYRTKIRGREIPFGDFLRRRLRSIYPIYLISNLVMLGIYLFRDGLFTLDLDEFLMMVTLQAGGGLTNAQPYNYPTWFVSSLMLCYILYYALTYHAKNDTQYRCGQVAMLLIGYILMENLWMVYFLYTPNGFAILTFFLGAMMAEVYPLLTDRRRKQLAAGSLGILTVVGFMAMRYGFHIITSNIGSLFAFFICPEVLFVALACPPVARFLQWKPVQFLGRISTSVFFWHAVIFEFFMNEVYALGVLPRMYEVRYALYLVAVILLSWLSEYLFRTYLPPRAQRDQI